MKKILLILLFYLLSPYIFADATSNDEDIIFIFNTATCTATYGSELYPSATATSVDPDASDDANNTNWTASGANLANNDTNPSIGTYNFSVVSDAASDRISTNLGGYAGIDDGDFVKLSLDGMVVDAGDTFQCTVHSGTTTPTAITMQSFQISETSYAAKAIYYLINEGKAADTDYLVCYETIADNIGTLRLDNFSIKEATLCYGSELVGSNSGASDVSGEVNSVGIWDDNKTAGMTVEVTGDQKQAGSYSIRSTASANGDRYSIDLQTAFGLVVGKRYIIDFRTLYNSGNSTVIKQGAAAGTSGTQLLVVGTAFTTWQRYANAFIYSESYRYLNVIENDTANDASMYIDNFSIKEVTDD